MGTALLLMVRSSAAMPARLATSMAKAVAQTLASAKVKKGLRSSLFPTKPPGP